MFNKDVEKLFRKEKCSRDSDLICVKFLSSFNDTEDYDIIEYREQGDKSIKSTFKITVPNISHNATLIDCKLIDCTLIDSIVY